MNSNNDNGKKSFGEKIKEIWKKIPLGLKLKIIVIGGVGIILISIIALISLTPLNFLFYSDDIQNENSEVGDAYDEYWNDLCEEDSEICKEDQKEAAKKLKEDQTAFYDRLDSLSNEYLSNDEKEKKEQRYLVLTTVFYGYDIDQLTQGGVNPAFELDDPDNNEMTVSEDTNIYKQEKDTLKELVKQFKVTTAVCARDFVDENNNLTEVSDELKDSEGNSFYFSFFEKVQFNMGLYSNEEYEKARKECLEHYSPSVNPRVKIKEVKEGEASTEAFYKYLIESEYLDGRSQHKNTYQRYANDHDLTSDPKDWPEADRKTVRKQIADEIKSTVQSALIEQAKKDVLSNIITGLNRAYWWPIGSIKTESSGDILFARDEPQYTYITSGFGGRNDPITGVWVPGHGALDIQGDAGSTNVISTMNGTVVEVITGCYSYGDGSCGGGYGNHIKILDTQGNYELYAHLHQDTTTVKVGDKVLQGQVIAKVGSSGRSTGAHLHYEMRGPDGVTKIDPLKYISQTDTRPKSPYYDYYQDNTPSKMFMLWLIAREGCADGWTSDHKYYYIIDGTVRYAPDTARTFGHGLTVHGTNRFFLKYGLDLTNYGDRAKVPVDIADKVKMDTVRENIDLIVAESKKRGITFNQYQIEALVSFLFNGGSGWLADVWPALEEYKNTQALFDNFFALYTKSGGEYLQGLYNRRKAEWDIWSGGNYNINFLKNPDNDTLERFCLEKEFVEEAWKEVE